MATDTGGPRGTSIVFYLARNNCKLGPYSLTQLQEFVRAGRLYPDDMLLQDGQQKWSKALSVPGLFPPQPAPHDASTGGPAGTGEQVYFRRDRVCITSARVIFGAKTYALSMITSVEAKVRRPNRLGPLLLILFALLFSLPRYIVMGGAVGLPLLEIAATAGSICWWMTQRPTYAVMLCTAAREVQAYSSGDARIIDEIVSAINRAIVARS